MKVYIIAAHGTEKIIYCVCGTKELADKICNAFGGWLGLVVEEFEVI